VAYCDTALTQDAKNIIESSETEFLNDIINEDGLLLASKDDANKYYQNFNKDNKKSCDRKVYRKEYYKPNGSEEYIYEYKEIASLNTTIG
jgi:hypothetical protein